MYLKVTIKFVFFRKTPSSISSESRTLPILSIEVPYSKYQYPILDVSLGKPPKKGKNFTTVVMQCVGCTTRHVGRTVWRVGHTTWRVSRTAWHVSCTARRASCNAWRVGLTRHSWELQGGLRDPRGTIHEKFYGLELLKNHF